MGLTGIIDGIPGFPRPHFPGNFSPSSLASPESFSQTKTIEPELFQPVASSCCRGGRAQQHVAAVIGYQQQRRLL